MTTNEKELEKILDRLPVSIKLLGGVFDLELHESITVIDKGTKEWFEFWMSDNKDIKETNGQITGFPKQGLKSITMYETDGRIFRTEEFGDDKETSFLIMRIK